MTTMEMDAPSRPTLNTDTAESGSPTVFYRTVKVNGLDIFYREAGPKDAPVILLPHGFPTSSHMFRNLIPALADEFRLIAPDYPGFGNSSMPTVDEFEYTFENLTNMIEQFTEQLVLTKYSLYAQDYGAPISYRLALKHPERVQALVVQNGNAYDEGIDNDFWEPIKAYWKEKNPASEKYIRGIFAPAGTIFQYVNGVRDSEVISPDNWNIDQPLLDRPGNDLIQLALFYSYGSNPPLYPAFQAFFRDYQPPTLVVWGKNDVIFPAEGAEPYKRDLKNLEYHLLDTGHFALEEDGAKIAGLMRNFLRKNVTR
jgi:pimeloyl-ACP methyl ester carboxylesterase